MASARWPHAGIEKGYVTAYNSLCIDMVVFKIEAYTLNV